jgi:hypothetical protein
MFISSRFVRLTATLVVGAALGATVALGGATATGAVSTTTTSTESAVASWVTSGPVSTNVGLQVTEESGPTTNSIFFLVNENYCIPSTNTEVFLSYFAQGPVAHQIFAVSPNLAAAVLLSPTLTVNATKETAPTCQPNGSDLTTVFSGPITISLFGLWHATGPAETTFPGNVERPATAAVSSPTPGPIDLSHLGVPSFASLSKFTAPAAS